MTKRRRNRKPSTPQEIASMRAARIQHEADITNLKAQPDVRVVIDNRGKIQAAMRLDVFEMMRSNKGLDEGAYEASRRLERDIASANGVDRPAGAGRVDEQLSMGAFDFQIDARRKVDAVLALCGPINEKLLRAILEPQFAGILTRWRETVAGITGETHERVQTAMVRQACKTLAEAYRSMDYGSRRQAVAGQFEI